MSQSIVRKLRHLEYRGQVDELTLVGQTVSAAVIAIPGEGIGYSRIRSGVTRLVSLEWTNAVRPRVVRIDGDPFGRSLPQFQKHAVVRSIAAALNLDEVGHILAGLLEIDQLQYPPRVRVGRSRTRGAGGGLECIALGNAVPAGIRNTGEINGGIQLLRTQDMNRVASQIAGGYQKVSPQLALNRQVPVLSLSRIDIAQYCEISIGDKRRGWTELSGEGVAAWNRRPRVGEAWIDEVRTGSPRRNDGRPQVVLGIGIVIPDPSGSPD